MIHVQLDDGTGKKYDEVVNTNFVPDRANDVHAFTKTDGTPQGLPVVMLIGQMQLADNTPVGVKIFLTGRELLHLAASVAAAHPSCTPEEQPPAWLGPTPPRIAGNHLGIAYEAMAVEKCWIITTEPHPGQVSIAFNEMEVRQIARHLINEHLGIVE